MANKRPTKSWVKGQSGNPKGRPPILLPELQRDIDENRGKVKELILRYLGMTEEQIGERQRKPDIPFIEKILGQCLEKTANDGDVIKFRALLEIVFGKIPEDRDPFQITPDEQMLVVAYRKRLEDERLALTDSSKDSRRADPKENEKHAD